MKHYLVFRVLLCVAIVVILSPSTEMRAEEQSPSGGGDGYAWERLGNDEVEKTIHAREIMIKFYLDGFVTGYMSACIDVKDFAKSTKQFSALNRFCQKIGREESFPKDPQYYVREIDSFLKTYPLCRRQSVSTLFLELSQVWFHRDKLSYEDVGKTCLKLDK